MRVWVAGKGLKNVYENHKDRQTNVCVLLTVMTKTSSLDVSLTVDVKLPSTGHY